MQIERFKLSPSCARGTIGGLILLFRRQQQEEGMPVLQNERLSRESSAFFTENLSYVFPMY
jgi:hypothetical protein